MAYRGGRGRGRFGGGARANYAEQKPFVLFPEIKLPRPPKETREIIDFIRRKDKLESYLRSSPYYLGDGTSISDPLENLDPERYSDREKPKKKMSLIEFLQPTAAHFPRELVEGIKDEPRKKRKKVEWDTETDLKKFDFFAKLEQKQEKSEDEKKEGEEDDQVVSEEDEGEFSDNGDYDQNIDFDDDEDDFNMEDDKDDEGSY